MPKLVHTLKRANSIAISPDGKLIATATATQINLFDAASYQQVALFRDCPNSIVSFSPNNTWLLFKSVERRLGLFDLKSMRLFRKFSVKNNTQSQDYGICFSSDESKIINLVYGNDLLGYISIWDTAAWTEQRYFEGQNNVFTHIQYCPKKARCFISGIRRPAGTIKENRSFYLWFAPKTGQADWHETDFKNNEVFIYSSRDDSIFAYRPHSTEGKIHLLKTSQTVSIACDGTIQKIAISHDNTKVAVMFNKKATLYAYPSFQKLADIDTQDSFGPIVFSPDDKLLLIGTWKAGFIYDITA